MQLELKIEELSTERAIAGSDRCNLKTLEGIYDIALEVKNGYVLTNASIDLKAELEIIFENLVAAIKLGAKITPRDVVYLVNLVKNDNVSNYLKLFNNKKALAYTFNNRPIYPKTLKQMDYLKLLDSKDIIFALGAAGTGKTYLAIAYAVNLLKHNQISKIILTRPAVEAGESLGFLPGDLKEKVDPYLRPLYDALYDTLGAEQTEGLIARQIIEIAPLAYMRGRTLENSFIILDEAQNATIDQLKMFLTRLGFNSKMVITGDPSQVDLPNYSKSGLKVSADILIKIPEIGRIYFDSIDVVRHPLVGKIIEAYEAKNL